MVFIKYEEEWNVNASSLAKNTFNPIRNILETMNIQPHPDKPMISLSIGDPTIFGNLNPSSNAISAITEALKSGKYNGYAPSSGYVESRQAIADHVSCGGKLTSLFIEMIIMVIWGGYSALKFHLFVFHYR